MNEIDYTYTFNNIDEKLKKGHLLLVDHNTDLSYTLQIAVDDEQLSFINYRSIAPLLADIIDIASAVHMADRLSKEKGDMPRRILLRIPLRTLEMLDKPTVQQNLQKVLYWFTEDHWSFEFIPYLRHGRSSQIQIPLPMSQGDDPFTHVVLWSGGLDAFAGVYQQLQRDKTACYLLFGTGSNDMISSVQQRMARTMETFFPGRTRLVQLPFRFKDKGQNVKKSSRARSRGFVFLLLGAVCAYHKRQNRVYVFENGIGALNLPFRKSEVGLDHSRSVHPLSLHYMSELLSNILGYSFAFENPFLYWTKAQMCKEPLLGGAAQAIFNTVSCDSRHRKRPMQCGYCSSCLLRRQAIAANEMIDETAYLITSGRQRRSGDAAHFQAMMAQVGTMRELLFADDSWQKMSQRYSTLNEILDKTDGQKASMQQCFLRLYQNYVCEWDKARPIIEHEFLE